MSWGDDVDNGFEWMMSAIVVLLVGPFLLPFWLVGFLGRKIGDAVAWATRR
jgi:hypothetical protein